MIQIVYNWYVHIDHVQILNDEHEGFILCMSYSFHGSKVASYALINTTDLSDFFDEAVSREAQFPLLDRSVAQGRPLQGRLLGTQISRSEKLAEQQ